MSQQTTNFIAATLRPSHDRLRSVVALHYSPLFTFGPTPASLSMLQLMSSCVFHSLVFSTSDTLNETGLAGNWNSDLFSASRITDDVDVARFECEQLQQQQQQAADGCGCRDNAVNKCRRAVWRGCEWMTDALTLLASLNAAPVKS